jgi:hypothetical protein
MLMKQILLFLIFLVVNTIVFSQISGYKDSIEIVKRPFGGMDLYQHGRKLRSAEVMRAMQTNPGALKYFKKARTNNAVAAIFGAAGGFLIGYELGYAVGGGKVNGAVLGAGLALIGVGIPFGIAVKKNTKKAVFLYNGAFR